MEKKQMEQLKKLQVMRDASNKAMLNLVIFYFAAIVVLLLIASIFLSVYALVQGVMKLRFFPNISLVSVILTLLMLVVIPMLAYAALHVIKFGFDILNDHLYANISNSPTGLVNRKAFFSDLLISFLVFLGCIVLLSFGFWLFHIFDSAMRSIVN